ncbi:hypothetical protein ALI22I_10770 [Saccharothrix sp. ALI-22-I]|uniref:AfsR/SARP family transcriptional regulator n=1 Tax=Saccharothrix sp. ALI-22-I TaxID=1933778 RepID=UPI00097C12B1|nr:helix-turn-helix domain-containing protein [Saccharothrix sp. ALI-22-I]ONI90910.1 hypothetical protein ALI22I_10770 [Saccharothrix sp. ALI-22-I]
MIFRVLGPQAGARKPATLLAALLLHANAWVSLDELIDEIWQEQAVPVSAERNVRTYVWQLRQALPAGRIDARPRSYRLRVSPGEVDADVARALSLPKPTRCCASPVLPKPRSKRRSA